MHRKSVERFRRFLVGIAVLPCLWLLACNGGGSGGLTTGGNGGQGGGGGAFPPPVGVTSQATTLTANIMAVTIASPPVVTFSVVNENGTPFVGVAASNVRFTLAKLVPGANGEASRWQSYINRVEQAGAAGPGTQDTIQANTESGGTFSNHGDGTYTYTFATDITQVTSPIAVTYEPGLTHRLGLQISGGSLPVANAVHTWRPADGATNGILRRDIVQTASCNECHGKLALHGGGRIETQYCVTCHNPGSTDANSGNTVDFRVMIHKIHRGENLPSVESGGEYAIWGFNNTKQDFSDVVYPQDIRNCSKCHDAADAATPQASHWMTQPSREACGACHDDVNFTDGTNHPGGPASNDQCAICHKPNSSGLTPGTTLFNASVEQAHLIPGKADGKKFALNIISVTNSAPGQFPVITYEITDPTNGNARYNILNTADPVWANGSVSILIGWDNLDHHNFGNGSATTPASAVSLNGKAASSGNNAAPTANPDGTFTVTSLRAIPASIIGSGVAGMTGRAAGDLNGDGDFTDTDDRIPIKSVVKYFAITDASPVPRRRVVDIVNQCDQCHDQLTLHGESRTDEPQLCVICHNANNTDIARRPADPTTTLDGKKEESIHFKTMIHGIHSAGFREKGLVIYGFGNTPNDFGGVRFPGVLSNCNTCHRPNTFTPPLPAGVLATTIDSGASRPDPNDDINVTPTAAACSACHDATLARSHMEQNGASFSMVGDPGSYGETCAVCHGQDRIADVKKVHGIQ